MYLNPIYIIDFHAKSLYKNESTNVTNVVSLVDKAVERFVQSKGVSVDDIPIDGDGYATSYTVIEYAKLKTYILLFESYRGTAHGDIEDIYMSKKEDYKEELACVVDEASASSILQDTDLPRSAFISNSPVY